MRLNQVACVRMPIVQSTVAAAASSAPAASAEEANGGKAAKLQRAHEEDPGQGCQARSGG